MNRAIGMIETYGLITAIEAADAGLKAADVKLSDLQFVKGGIVTVIFTGDVAAVKSSVDAGNSAGTKIGKILSTHVIARPDVNTNLLYGKVIKKCDTVPKSEKPKSEKPVKKEPVPKKTKNTE